MKFDLKQFTSSLSIPSTVLCGSWRVDTWNDTWKDVINAKMNVAEPETIRKTHHLGHHHLGHHDRDRDLHDPDVRHRCATLPCHLGRLAKSEFHIKYRNEELTTPITTSFTTFTASESTVPSTLAVPASETAVFTVTTPETTIASTVVASVPATIIVVVPSESPTTSTATFGLREAIFILLRWRRGHIVNVTIDTDRC